MKPEQIKDEINPLGMSEKWQKRELDKRYKEYKRNSLTLHDWEDVHAELREKYK